MESVKKVELPIESTHDSRRILPPSHPNVKFEVFGEEMLDKNVKASGNSGRVYLPPEWIGHRVKIIRIN